MNLKPEKKHPNTATVRETFKHRFKQWFKQHLRAETLVPVVGIIALGIIIPNITGLLGNGSPDTALFWIGYEYTIGISFIVWQGTLLLWRFERKLRLRYPTFVLKPILLFFYNLFFVAPVTVLLCLGWLAISHAPIVQWDMIYHVTLWVVIADLFVTFVYETVFLAQERVRNIVRLQQVERAKVEAELEALKMQLDPHFVFNSLNTLSFLIEERPAEALEFNENLADVYRYMLTHRSKTIVRLTDEIEFLQSYYTLLRLRFRGGVQLVVSTNARVAEYGILPLALQLLLENAVKHNEFDERRPLVVEVRVDNDAVSVSNPRRPKRVMKSPKPPKQNSTNTSDYISSQTSSVNNNHNDRQSQQSLRTGLRNLDERSQLITRQRIAIVETADRFFVRLPLVDLRSFQEPEPFTPSWL